MKSTLIGKHILLVKGSLIAEPELRDALVRLGARVSVTTNLITAFDQINRKDFDGAIVDHGLHNEAFDLCTELRALGIPYISAIAPHRLQGVAARRRDADATASRIANLVELQQDDVFSDDFADYVSIENMPSEMRAS